MNLDINMIIEILSATVLIGIGTNSTAAEAQQQLAATNSVNESSPELEPARSTRWQNGVGNGFTSSAQDFSTELGISLGMAAFGSVQAHDFALISPSYGHMLWGVLGEGTIFARERMGNRLDPPFALQLCDGDPLDSVS